MIFEEKENDLNHFLKDLSSLYNSGEFSDVIFTVGTDKKKFKLHKNILSARSSFFDDYFSKNNVNHIEFENMNPIYFEIIVKYFYTGE